MTKIREYAPEWTAYLAAALILGVAGRFALPGGPEKLHALSAGWSPIAILTWAAAMIAAGALLAVVLRRRDMVTHVPLALCTGLLAARFTAGGPRVERLELLLPAVPNRPWMFTLEIGVWVGLLWLGLESAERVAAWMDRHRPEPSGPTGDKSAVGGTWNAPAEDAITAGVWTIGATCFRRIPRPGLSAVAGVVAAAVALVPVWLLLQEYVPLESRQLSCFALWFGFLLGSSSVLGLWKRGRFWAALIPPAALGACAYLWPAMQNPPPQPGEFLHAFGRFALPIDFVAAGGVGALTGRRVGSTSTSIWWLFEMVIWSPLREFLTTPLPGEKPRAPMDVLISSATAARSAPKPAAKKRK
jgi:hypothetical protein